MNNKLRNYHTMSQSMIFDLQTSSNKPPNCSVNLKVIIRLKQTLKSLTHTQIHTTTTTCLPKDNYNYKQLRHTLTHTHTTRLATHFHNQISREIYRFSEPFSDLFFEC